MMLQVQDKSHVDLTFDGIKNFAAQQQVRSRMLTAKVVPNKFPFIQMAKGDCGKLKHSRT